MCRRPRPPHIRWSLLETLVTQSESGKAAEARARGLKVAHLARTALRDETMPECVSLDPGVIEALRVGGVYDLVLSALPPTHPVRQGAAPYLQGEAFRALEQHLGLRDALAALRDSGIDPVLFKGPSIARYYPRSGERPSGDLDILVDISVARRALDALEPAGFTLVDSLHTRERAGWLLRRGGAWVDLQTDLWPLNRRDIACALSSAEWLQLGDVRVRVLPPALELRLLAVHAAKHGFLQPNWSCDLVVAARAHPAVLWGEVFRADRGNRIRIAAALDLAIEFLGADLPTGVTHRVRGSAAWLYDAVLELWGGGGDRPYGALVMPRLTAALGRGAWREVMAVASEAWPSPLVAQVELGWPPSAWLAGPAVPTCLARRIWNQMRALMP
jgi:hypothetical protein